jgi:NAD+ synthase
MGNAELLQNIEANLQFNPANEIEWICQFIQGEVKRRGVRGVTIGLSGGLDSTTCAFLCARCLPAKQIHLVSLPERDSNIDIHHHVQTATHALGMPFEEIDQTELFTQLGLYEQMSRDLAADRTFLERSIHILRRFSNAPALFPWAQQYSFHSRHGILAWLLQHRFWHYAQRTEKFIIGKVRTRMLVLSLKAIQNDCLMICTTDRSEWAVGFYDPHGDGVGDIAPLRHLYKTQIRELARALGVPEEIVLQPSSGDLGAGLPNETAIGLPYEKLDRILVGLSMEMKDEEIAASVGVRKKMVKAIRSACIVADERRCMLIGVTPV